MDTVGIMIVAVGVVAFALVSQRLEGSAVTPPMLFVSFGWLIGPAAFGIVQADFDHAFIHGLAEVTLILVLFSDAARIDLSQLRLSYSIPLRLLAIGLPLTVGLGFVVAVLMPLGLNGWEAALLAAVLAPTDAALGLAVVNNPQVPARVRQALNVESGLNDGIALPVVLMFASLAGAAHEGFAESAWLMFGLAQITLGPLVGVLIGGVGARLMDWAHGHGWIAEPYEGAGILALSMLSYAGAEFAGGNGFIAAFAAGLVFGNSVCRRCSFLFEFAEAEGSVLMLVTFMIFGASILPQTLEHGTLAAVVYAILSLTVIRMVPVALSLIGSGLKTPSVWFIAWFGPRGLASILYALFVLEEVHTGEGGRITVITMIAVTMSIFAHGASAAPWARRYARVIATLKSIEESRPIGGPNS